MCENEKKKMHSIEMTSGSLWKNLLLFSLPLMGSQVLEVLFNLSDVAVVGRFADYMALGAVGSTTLLVTLFTGILIGMGAGVNVRVAHELGAENRKGTEETIHTSLLLCAIAGLLVCVVCLLFSGQMLSMMNTKPELMDQAVLYMKIYALGMPAMAVYNFGNGVLSARGDTKRPLIYLSIAGVINVLLNLFFVIVCHMAAAGVATASAIALYISAALVMIHLSGEKTNAGYPCVSSIFTQRPVKQYCFLVFPQVCRTEFLPLQICSYRPASTPSMQSQFPEMLPLQMQTP